ncbi:MAG: DUF3800 domain-containing protein [Actinomycetota bacterium]
MATNYVPEQRLYIDESGDHGYSQVDRIENRFLGLLGCVFERSNDYISATNAMNRIKNKFWPNNDPDNPVIFHREEMLRCENHFTVLKDKAIRQDFDKEILELLRESKYTIINIVLDKRIHQNRYDVPFDPYHYCLTIILQRYCGWLNYFSTTGDVMAESRGNRPDSGVKSQYRKIYEDGTMFLDKSLAQETLTSKKIKIKPKSHNIPGLQFADLLAWPLKEKLLFEHGIRKDRYMGMFSESIYCAVEDKFNRRFDTGKVLGYGEVFVK